PVIVVNGTYLNGQYKGTLFIACTQDANNNIFILAFEIGDNENEESWRWFLEMLKRAYGLRNGLCIISNRHNRIRNAIELVYLEAIHGICSYHLLKNLKTHYAKSGHDVTHAFNATVRASTMVEFEYQMQQLDSVNKEIRGYLLDVGSERWSRLHVPTNRYFTTTSSIIEFVNAVTKAVFPASHNLFEVCKIFQVDQLSCLHALSVFATLKLYVYNLCSNDYTTDAYVNTYKETVMHVGNRVEWILPEDVKNITVLGPNKKRSSGCPIETRKESRLEYRFHTARVIGSNPI
ncbi:uncharacterized protein LOC111378875, partial [Olea europaea var. sylvestris]|uniref:uncharacterized protein LOC111378875 n=1 Tax=Olea europaea var. sylvestris TaxID=158386 RepID=UPI000C1CF2D5